MSERFVRRCLECPIRFTLLRWAQLTLVEDDPGKYDPAFLLGNLQTTIQLPGQVSDA